MIIRFKKGLVAHRYKNVRINVTTNFPIFFDDAKLGIVLCDSACNVNYKIVMIDGALYEARSLFVDEATKISVC